MNNVPGRSQSIIDAINMYGNDYTVRFSTPITSVENTTKNIYLGELIWYEFTSEYYKDKNDTFEMLFQKYTASDVDKIYNPSTVIEWKSNMNKVAYKDNNDLGVHITFLNNTISQIMNVDHWPKCITNEIEWFQFKEILEHTDFHAKGDYIIFNSLLKVFHIFR